MNVAASYIPPPRRETRSICCYCGVGCGVVIESETGVDGHARIVGVRGDETHPANFGRLCSKGSTLHLTAVPEVYAQVRALINPRQSTPIPTLKRFASNGPAASIRLARRLPPSGWM